MRYPLILTFSITLCFTVQSLALRSVGGRTNKSESNFFSSLARIQTGIRGQPETFLLGSSITGRLPDRSNGFAGVANLGCDGANAVDTLRAIDRGQIPWAPRIIIEGNTLYRSVGKPPTEISSTITSPWFQIGSELPNLGATARPSAFLYSRLLAGKIGEAHHDKCTRLDIANLPKILMCDPPILNKQELTLIKELSEIINRLEVKGTQFLITLLPPGGKSDSVHVRLPVALAIESGVPFWDLVSGLPPDSIRFTDGVHMDPQSAATVMTLLLEKNQSE